MKASDIQAVAAAVIDALKAEGMLIRPAASAQEDACKERGSESMDHIEREEAGGLSPGQRTAHELIATLKLKQKQKRQSGKRGKPQQRQRLQTRLMRTSSTSKNRGSKT